MTRRNSRSAKTSSASCAWSPASARARATRTRTARSAGNKKARRSARRPIRERLAQAAVQAVRRRPPRRAGRAAGDRRRRQGRHRSAHVFTAFNPQGCTVTSFKAPSAEELKHDYLWRIHKNVPPRGEVGVFNRSHYEDVLVVRVDKLVPKDVVERALRADQRLRAHAHREQRAHREVLPADQQGRAAQALRGARWTIRRSSGSSTPRTSTKRKKWDDYQAAYEDALTRCSTDCAPWYVIPADRKWFRNLAVSQVIAHGAEKLPLRFPKPTFDPAKIRVR